MPVGVNEVFDVPGVKAQLTDVVQNQIQGLGVAGVQQDQTVPGVDQVVGYVFGAYEVQVAPHTEGGNIAVPRSGKVFGHSE